MVSTGVIVYFQAMPLRRRLENVLPMSQERTVTHVSGPDSFEQRADSGSRTRDQQFFRLSLYPLSYIQVGAEGSDDRRHAVLQGSRASEAV